jgi:ligand-binding sensor domain-containing protein
MVKRGYTTTTLLLITLPLFFWHIGYSQPQYSSPEVFNEINGLPNNEIRCLLKDSKGYLWIGTGYGLAKYDGNKFSVYKHQSNRNSISGDVITSIIEDTRGNMLIGANGLSILNRNTGDWENFLHDPSNINSISSPSVWSIAQESDSIFWLVTSNGIDRFNIDTEKFQHFPFLLNSRIALSQILDITPKERITLSIGISLYKFNLQNKIFEEIPGFNSYSNTILYKNNLVGIKNPETNNHQLVRYNLLSGQEHNILGNIEASSILFKKGETLFLVRGNRILSFNSEFDITRTIIFQQKSDITGIEYSCALKEDNGTIWIGTNNGLYKILPNTPFQFIDRRSGLPNDYIRSLTIDSNNNLWIGVRQGPVYRISNIDEFLINRTSQIIPIKFPTLNGEVYATNKILELQNGDLLFVTNRSLFLYNTRRGVFIDEFVIPNNHQYFSAIEVENGVLIGSLEKPTLFKVNIKNGKIKKDHSFKLQSNPDVVYSLFKDQSGQVWIGSEGLYKMNLNQQTNENELTLSIPAINESNYSSNSIWSFLETDDNKLFISTTNNGFYIYNKSTNEIEHFSKANGLPTDFTCTVLKDHHSNFWLSTKEGVTYIESESYSMRNYPIKNGQYNTDFTFKCGAKTDKNQLLFGSKQGIVYFNPDSIKSYTIIAPLYINEFKVFDNVIRRELEDGDTIRLEHNENFFSLEFSLLDFKNPQEIKYTYQLLNYDRAERELTGSFNSASYTDVPPGNYTFRLISKTTWDLDYTKSLEVFVIIKPAFNQTIWFRATIYLVIFLVIAILVISYLRRQALHGRLQKMELNLLRSQINPHFIFNTLTSIQHTILTNSKDEAVGILSRFSRLMRMFLDYSRMEYIPLEKALIFYKTFVSVHSVNLDEEIDFEIKIDISIDVERIMISPMLIQPFLENAIVHGLSPKGKDMKLKLEISQTNGWLQCIVHDNGIGRTKANEIGQKKARGHKSMGIEITSKSILLQLKKGKFIKESFSITDNYDEKGIPIGTTVYLKIPYKQNK